MGPKIEQLKTYPFSKHAEISVRVRYLGRIAAFPGTLMTPMYREAFLGEMSSVMSSKGDPLTLSRSKRSLVSSSDVDEPPSNTFTGSLVMTPGEPRKSEKFP